MNVKKLSIYCKKNNSHSTNLESRNRRFKRASGKNVWVKGENADMVEYMIILFRMLSVIHQENLVLLSLISGKDMDDKFIKDIDNAFEESYKIGKK